MACFAMFCYKLSKLAVFIEYGKSLLIYFHVVSFLFFDEFLTAG